MPFFCVLIPSRGRPESIRRMFKKMPFLDAKHTFLGIQRNEWDVYKDALSETEHVRMVPVDNPNGSVAIAREKLRRTAVERNYEWYVVTDDNASFTEDALYALVWSAKSFQEWHRKLTFMAGMHSTAKHFDRHHIAQGIMVCGDYHSYAAPGFIFHAVPHAWYTKYAYPPGCFALEDRHMMFAAIRAGHREFRVCMEAPFTKKRYEPGGQGDIEKRRWNCGRAIEQLAHDFPEYMGVKGTWSTPWKAIFDFADGAKLERLPGGAMRKGEVLVQRTMTIKRRRT